MVNAISFSNPNLTKGDVNGDKLEDVYVGGGYGEAGKLFLQQKNGSFVPKSVPLLRQINKAKIQMRHFLMQMVMDLLICM